MSLEVERCNSEKEKCDDQTLKNKEKESEVVLCNGVKNKVLEVHARKANKALRIIHGRIYVNWS